MGRKQHKFKLLLDENFLNRDRLPLLNKRYNAKHIKSDFRQTGLQDPEVYAFAVKEHRIIVTFNDKDFISLASKSKKTGIIGVSINMTTDHIDKKLAAILRRSKPSDIYGKFIYVSEETET